MAYKFQLGAATVSGSLTRDAGDLTIRAHDNSVKITLDTAGAIDAAGSVTAGTSFIIGSADLNEVDMEKLDGITNGTAAANKALVADANVDITGLRNVTGTGAITAGTSFIIGSADLNETDMEKLDGITNGTAAASKAVVLDGSKDITGLNNVSAAQYTGTLVNSLDVAANGGIGMTPFDNSAAVADLKLSASYLSAEAVAVSEDQFLFYDADGGVHRESFADLATAMAGAGLTATNGVLSTEAGATTGSVPDGAVLSEGYNFITGTTGGSYTLPNGPSAGDRVVFKNSSAGTATIAGFAANTIDGVTSIVLESPYAAVTMVYSKVSGSWAIV